MVHRDLSLHATPLQPTFHSIQKSLAACWFIADQARVVSVLQQVDPPLALRKLVAPGGGCWLRSLPGYTLLC